MDAVQNDLSDVAKLDQHFTDRRAQELALEAETQRAQHVVQMGGVRNERIRKAGIAALLCGAGIGLAFFGASFLIAPNTRVVTVTKEVPGPERVVTVTKEVPGPERVVTVTKEVPGPERLVTKEVPGPERVVVKEVPGPERVVTKEVPGPVVFKEVPERIITKEVPGPERVVTKEVPVPVHSSEEKKFVENPDYQSATYRGRIVKSVDGKALSFEDGKNFLPYDWDAKAGKVYPVSDKAFNSDQFVGDLAMCKADEHQLWYCAALHGDQKVDIGWKDVNASALPPTKSAPTLSDVNTVDVVVDVSGYRVKAMVDTGCTWPLAIPNGLADALLKEHHAAYAGTSKSRLADGSVKDTNIILIDSITVDGRTLNTVEAAVSPDDNAPVLLGLSALKRLGPFTIDNGGIVFTSDQPT